MVLFSKVGILPAVSCKYISLYCFCNIQVLGVTGMPNKKRKGFRRVRQRTRERPSKRKQWSENQMLAALDAVIKDGLSGNKAAFYIIYHLLH